VTEPVVDEPKDGYFEVFGGRYVPETLWHALEELAEAHDEAMADPAFTEQLDEIFNEYGNRPTPLTYCPHVSDEVGARVYLKREDLVHGGAHKFNNVMGQALLADRMGKDELIAETGAGQHGVATAMAGAAMGLDVTVYMGAKDIQRQQLNVFRMRLVGADVEPVETGAGTLKDAVNEALRTWVERVEDVHYCLGSVVGPDPYPRMVRDYQAVIGDELREQCLVKEEQVPDVAVACVGGGSNAMGTFYPLRHDDTRLIGVEAGGQGTDTDEHAASLVAGDEGVLHGAMSYLLQDEDGQITEPHSVSAGLDYPGVGPEHAHYQDTGRAEYVAATDEAALEATRWLCETEGILPALEPAHALAHLRTMSDELAEDDVVVLTLSGRGDKDVHTLRDEMDVEVPG
jgi:tryptophan synthase beta chain